MFKSSIYKFISAIFGVMLLLVVGLIAYQETHSQELTVRVKLEDSANPFQAIRNIVPPNASVVEVREIDRIANEYELILCTRSDRRHLLEWLHGRSEVEHVEVD